MKQNIDPIAYKLKELFPKTGKVKTKRILWIMPHAPLKAEIEELKKILGKNISTVNIGLTIDEIFHLIHTPSILQKLKEDFQLDAIVSFIFLEPLDIPILIPIYQFLHSCQQKPCPNYNLEKDWIDRSHRHFRFTKFAKLKPIIGLTLEEA